METYGNKEEYLKNYSAINRNTFCVDIKIEKAKKVATILKEHTKNQLNDLNCLELGGSSGIMASFISDRFKEMTVLDIDKNAIDFANKNYKKNNLRFIYGDATDTHFKNDSFDVIICNHVYEYVNKEKLINEIYRLLKPRGFCYFTAANKYTIIEPHHYKLPFLSWLPKKLANIYVRITKKGHNYYEEMWPYWRIRKLFRKFKVYNYTINITKNPKYYNTNYTLFGKIISLFPEKLLGFFLFIFPSYVFILEKKV